MKYTLKHFIKSYQGFDFENGTIVLVKRSTCASFIIDKGGCWRSMLDKHSDTNVWGWNHSRNVMVITLDI